MAQQATKQATVAEGKPQPAAAGPGREQIAALAYQLWEARGCPEGTPEEDWFNAEKELAAKSAA
jgi:hypothetical protein